MGRKRTATEEVIFTRSAETAGQVANGVACRNSLARPPGNGKYHSLCAPKGNGNLS